MFAAFDAIPTSTSLLMQCGYRSKVCTNVRATKIDGSLHNLCEFHRRKANASQQRLHQRHREERRKRRPTGAIEVRQKKKACLTRQQSLVVGPIPFKLDDAEEPNASGFTQTDMDILALLLPTSTPKGVR